VGEQPRETTFWFSDVEGSTRLLAEVGDDAYRELLRAHRVVVRSAFADRDGAEVGTEGDSFFATFPSPAAAVAAAGAVQRALVDGPMQVRIGIHAGVAFVEEAGYVGLDVHRAARIAGVAHGRQVVISEAARRHLEVDVLDLGEHRLKDLSAPLRLFQLGTESFPPLRSLHRTNLPVPSTPFLGRADELAGVEALLGRPDVRLVTLTGPGGMGKTRLALQAAAAASEGFPDGVWWVPLAALEDPSLVLPTIAQTLQLDSASLAESLHGRRVLIVIDNAEHLLPDVANAIALLAAIDGPRLCVTSRERLALPGEHVFSVPALDDRDAVDLFVARARQLDASFAEVAALRDLCRLLDNLPLAIELAAARTPLFSVDELSERLARTFDLLQAGRGVEQRHRTLQAAIDWSYRLLDDEEQRIYRALAVFRGGCTVEALEAVAEARLETIASLLDKSLLRRRDGEGGPRLFMLEMVRRHAAGLLSADAERDALIAAGARYFGDLSEQAYSQVMRFGGDDGRWWGVMRDERDNVRAALALYDAAGDAASLARICAVEWLLWFFVGDPAEGSLWLQRALELGPPRHLLSTLENAYAAVLLVSGENGAAAELAARAVQHARELTDGRAECAGLITLAIGLTGDDPQRAADAFRTAAAAARTVGDDWWEALALANLAELTLRLGDREEAVRVYDELARLDGGRSSTIIDIDLFRAEICWIDGDLVRAHAALVRALEVRRRTLLHAAYDEVELAARMLASEGRGEDAAALLAAVGARHDELGLRVPPSWHESGSALEARLADELGGDAFASASARGRMLTLDETIALAIELLTAPPAR
jgi:predicted ATPase/class 3 adenylate cyclase